MVWIKSYTRDTIGKKMSRIFVNYLQLFWQPMFESGWKSNFRSWFEKWFFRSVKWISEDCLTTCSEKFPLFFLLCRKWCWYMPPPLVQSSLINYPSKTQSSPPECTNIATAQHQIWVNIYTVKSGLYTICLMPLLIYPFNLFCEPPLFHFCCSWSVSWS